ncbi:DUF3631 domain-containing protein [Telmatobacter sp. DSM 110680]|uniref:DUF3631 domain-containing protein n=1 Tax=Telmatobacter sp. DSM 110680 TaxID=3036704 RepID=A0AAU7DQV8_9BACT
MSTRSVAEDFSDIPVEPSKLDAGTDLDAIGKTESFIRRFCILPGAAYLPLALWTAATHVPDAFGAFPYITLTSPVKRCGKTRVLEILELLCAKPQRITSASPASIFRLMKDSPTLLLDEVEALRSSKPSESAQAILAILNAGHRQGATVTRCVPPDWSVEHFPVYGPKAFAAIGRLPDTLADRCICIPMQRKAASQRVARLLFARTPAEAEPLRNTIAAWAEAQRDTVREFYECMSDLGFLEDREADLWMPLFAVCTVAAPDRVDELERCARSLCGAKAIDDADDSYALKLLADVRRVWPDGRSHMLTAALLDALKRIPDSPWGESSQELTPRGLAATLRPFGPAPRQVRVDGGATGKGYLRAEFEGTFSRYLPAAEAESETCETTCMNAG